MNWLGNFMAVQRFEWRRSWLQGRFLWWVLLIVFPPAIVMLLRIAAAGPLPREAWTFFLFILIPMMTSMLGSFLWTSTTVSAELEAESWIYLAVQPHGRIALVLGKYLAAVAWVLPAALLGLTGALLLANPSRPWPLALCLFKLTCLSVPAYAAIYLLLGVIFARRAMLIAIMYTLVFELVVSMVPALINKLTIQYRLRALLVQWGEFEFDLNDRPGILLFDLLGDHPPHVHVVVLAVYTVLMIIATGFIVRSREYSAGSLMDG